LRFSIVAVGVFRFPRTLVLRTGPNMIQRSRYERPRFKLAQVLGPGGGMAADLLRRTPATTTRDTGQPERRSG
jgi:hypothetical protein